jgi:hypothetical protein
MYYSTNRNVQPRGVRLNPQPPSSATYFDPTMLTCSPCQSGPVNYCQTVQGGETEPGFDWLFESVRGTSAAAATFPVEAHKVSECCTTELDPVSGVYKTSCDVGAGCGWVAGPFLTEDMSCKFTTEGATYPTFEECRTAHPPPPSVGTGSNLDWFSPCGLDEVKNCYYPNMDTCLPAVFGKQRAVAAAAAAPSCPMYVCDGSSSLDIGGRRSFPSSACSCISNST